VESIEHPERYPLVSRLQPKTGLRRATSPPTRLARQGTRLAARR
jgi:hypothetical protein